ncbi:MAG: amino acid ABC transporter permease [Leucobacter sp.]|nr:amino acid ABC transporter permease [Leucobacter sp.]
MSDMRTGAVGQGAPQPPAHATPQAIEAIKLRHPWRMTFAVVILVVLVLFLYDAAFNRPVYKWEIVGQYLFDTRILEGAWYTLLLTIYSMVIAVILGVGLAIMRLSPNPVLKSVAWVYLWFFRGTPVYVQLVFWGFLPTIYKTVTLGIPFTEAIVTWEIKDLLPYFALAIIGLALNEAAYLAEIVRAGLLAVDKGQDEAAIALGLGWWHTMSRVILPQAMRVIIPPTGNEFISMLKTTSLVTAVPFTLDLFGRQRDIAAVLYEPVPMLIVASIWYLAVTSLLMVGQFYLERYYAKGVGSRPEVQKPTVETAMVTVVGVEADAATDDQPGGDRA